ncbi:hypothetical protein J4G37_57700, partial [Microvirga sp. 3-52]|nr:hypothetical protein [Microvirga sp. 3-52]
LIGMELEDLSNQLYSIVDLENGEQDILSVNEKSYKVSYNAAEKLIYLFDVTKQLAIETLYHADRTVLGILLVDNYDELSQAMDDQTRSQLNSLVTSLVTKWGKENGI